MKSLKTLSALAFTLLAVLALASAVQAKPNICRLQCTPSISCSILCTTPYGEIITCGEWGICGGAAYSQAATTVIDGTTNPSTPSGDVSSLCIPGETMTTPPTAAADATNSPATVSPARS